MRHKSYRRCKHTLLLVQVSNNQQHKNAYQSIFPERAFVLRCVVMSLSNQLRDKLHELENVQVPIEHLANDKENKTIHSDYSIVEQYKQSRDQYLTRQLKHALVESLKTYDGNTFVAPPAPSETAKLAAKRERDQKLNEVQDKATLISKKRLELQAKYSIFMSRRDQYKELLQEFELSESTEAADINYDDKDCIEEDLEARNSNLEELKSLRAELELRLRSIKDENMAVQRSLQEKAAQISNLHAERAPEYNISRQSLQHLEARNAEAKANLNQLVETKLMYDRLRGILEELFAVQICSIEPSQHEPSTDETMAIVIKILRKYEIRLGLKKSRTENISQHEAKVCSIKLLSDPIVKSPVINTVGESTAQLTIHDLNDLVQIAECRPIQNDNLAFIVREITARLTIVEKRVEMISDLQKIVLTNIGKLQDHSKLGSSCRQDQEVVCSFNEEQLTVVLLLTPDCPFVRGSVFIDQIVGLGGWDSTVLERIKVTMNSKEFQDPVALVQELREHVKSLQDEGLMIPKTPSLPKRNVNDMR